METSGGNSDTYRSSSSSGSSRRYGIQFSASNFIQAPLSALLEYSGILRTRSAHPESDGLIGGAASAGFPDHVHSRLDDSAARSGGGGEVSIRIIGAGEQEHVRAGLPVGQGRDRDSGVNGISAEHMSGAAAALDRQADVRSDGGSGEGALSSSISAASSPAATSDGEAANGVGGNNRESSYQRYDIQQVARWIEQILPFSLLLLVVFIRQHLQGFFVTIWIAAVLFKSNDVLRKQTALKGERKMSVLVGITLVFSLHVIGVYWWHWNDDLLYPLIMLPPKTIPPFWHAIFIIMVNDTMVRQAAMVIKCLLLMYYKNSRGRNYRKQGQMLTLVEYFLLLYRALLPAPVWYRFFLNKENGSLFSSLTTGLYLTFKLTSVVEKVQSFFAALKALSHKEVHYGSYATTEQVCSGSWDCSIKLWRTDSDGEEDIVSIKKRKVDADAILSEESQLEGGAVSTLVGHTQCVSSVVWPEHQTIYSASWDHSVRRWDVETGKDCLNLVCGKVVNCLDVGGESSSLIAAGGSDPVLRIWDPRKPGTLAPIFHFSSHSSWITACKWHAKSWFHLLSASYDGKVMLWDLRTAWPLAVIDSHKDKVLCADWWKGNSVISGGADSKLCISSGLEIQ